MRGLIAGMALLALAACDSGEVPSPTERANQQTPDAPAAFADEVRLQGERIIAGTEGFFFSAGQNEVTTKLTALLGEPTETGTQAECGSGPLDYASYPGGLAVHFQEGNFVGWLLRASDDPEASKISMMGDTQIGTSVEATETAPGFARFEASTLGEEFTLGTKVGGFFEEGEVSMFYSGLQCFAR